MSLSVRRCHQRLDYCNSLLAGCPKHLHSKLRKVQNYAARLIFRSAHVTPMLHSPQWLPPTEQLRSSANTRVFKNTILPNKVLWSALFLLSGSSYLVPAPCFCPSFYLHHFVQIFLENLSLLKSHFFSPIVLTYDSVCVCMCVCMCVFALYALNFKNMCV